MEYPSIDYSSIDLIVEEYFSNSDNDNINVIIIGANDGETKDFLTRYLQNENVSAVLVEPIRNLFLQLKRKFAGKQNLFFENSAIAKRSGKKVMYKIQPASDFPQWAVGLGSFSKDLVLNHENQISNVHKHLVKETVKSITLKNLISKYKLKGIGLIQIDTEGYDYEILKTIDFKNARPDIIIFEYLHLSFYQYFSSINLLQENNYWVTRNHSSFDLIAVDKDILS
jgi:FkbM family methyltransferase